VCGGESIGLAIVWRAKKMKQDPSEVKISLFLNDKIIEICDFAKEIESDEKELPLMIHSLSAGILSILALKMFDSIDQKKKLVTWPDFKKAYLERTEDMLNDMTKNFSKHNREQFMKENLQ
jgi:hypothetical protein